MENALIFSYNIAEYEEGGFIMIQLDIGVAYEIQRYKTKEYAVSIRQFPEIETLVEMREFEDGSYVVSYTMSLHNKHFGGGTTTFLQSLEEAWARAEYLIRLDLQQHLPEIRKERMRKSAIIDITFSEKNT